MLASRGASYLALGQRDRSLRDLERALDLDETSARLAGDEIGIARLLSAVDPRLASRYARVGEAGAASGLGG